MAAEKHRAYLTVHLGLYAELMIATEVARHYFGAGDKPPIACRWDPAKRCLSVRQTGQSGAHLSTTRHNHSEGYASTYFPWGAPGFANMHLLEEMGKTGLLVDPTSADHGLLRLVVPAELKVLQKRRHVTPPLPFGARVARRYA